MTIYLIIDTWKSNNIKMAWMIWRWMIAKCVSEMKRRSLVKTGDIRPEINSLGEYRQGGKEEWKRWVFNLLRKKEVARLDTGEFEIGGVTWWTTWRRWEQFCEIYMCEREPFIWISHLSWTGMWTRPSGPRPRRLTLDPRRDVHQNFTRPRRSIFCSRRDVPKISETRPRQSKVSK